MTSITSVTGKPDYHKYCVGDPTKFDISPPYTTPDSQTAGSIKDDAFIKQLVQMVSAELFRNEHQNVLHNMLFVPAIQQFAMLLRPWLLLLSTIFLLLLIVGIFQLVLLLTRPVHNQNAPLQSSIMHSTNKEIG